MKKEYKVEEKKKNIEENKKRDLGYTFRKMIDALINPESAIEPSPEINKTFFHSFLLITLTGIIITLISTSITLEFKIGNPFDVLLIILLAIINGIFFPIVATVFSSIIWICSSLFKGKQNFESQTNAIILTAIPIILLISVISIINEFAYGLTYVVNIINFVILLYAFFAIGKIVSKITELSIIKTFLVIISAVIIVVILFIFSYATVYTMMEGTIV